jgi:flagellin-like protein
MNISERLVGQDRGVSPVIAVILMVAITVILASVVGAYVLDISDSLSDSPPAATFEAEQSKYTVTDRSGGEIETDGGSAIGVKLVYTGGEKVAAQNLRVTVNGEVAFATDDEREIETADHTNALRPFDGGGPSGQINTGTSYVLLGSAQSSDIPDASLCEWWAGNGWGVANAGSPTELRLNYCGGGSGNDLFEDYDGGKLNKLSDGDMVRIIYDSASRQSTVLFEYRIK